MLHTDLNDAKIYDQLCDDIRKTDDISFKLMGFVPLVSGTGLLAILISDKRPDPAVLIILSLFAAAITLGLFRWELRNVQTCRWLIKCADKLEKKALEFEGLGKAYIPQPRSPQSIGKREAEKFIYSVTIVTWLIFPALLLYNETLDPRLYGIYFAASTIIAIATIISLFAQIEPDERNTAEKRKQ